MISPELQAAGSFVELLLEGGDPWGIVFFGCLDTGMPEQQLDRPQIGTGLQKFDAEGIAESVWMAFNPGHSHETVYSAAGAPNSGGEFGVVGPEEVLSFDGHPGERVNGIGRQSNIHGSASFHLANHETAIGPKSGSFQFNGITDSQSGIKKQQNECPGPGSRPGDTSGIVIVDAITRGKYGFNLARAEWHCGRVEVPGGPDLSGRICGQMPLQDKKLTECPDVLDFLPQGVRRDELLTHPGGPGPGVTPSGNHLNINLRNRNFDQFGKVKQCLGVTLQTGSRQIAHTAVLQITGDDACEVGGHVRVKVAGFEIGFPSIAQFLRPGPISRTDGTANAHASYRVGPVVPNRTRALREFFAFRPMRARFQMAAVKLDRHSKRLSRVPVFWHAAGTRRKMLIKSFVFNVKFGAAGGIWKCAAVKLLTLREPGERKTSHLPHYKLGRGTCGHAEFDTAAVL